ncbi:MULTISPECIES: hypothetical protein [unclassified Nocardioides]|uniref:hypothetical protein n=1 Tax=unclassified Nocardioides TaxID=2615069 RepID=UPI002406594D|nr:MULTISPECIES: hypothetical protein [unclassified Nocardioides]
MSGRVRRTGRVRDVYPGTGDAGHDETAVMVDATVLVLSPLAGVLVELVGDDGWVPVATVAAGLVERFGAPPDGDALAGTRTALADLAEQGVVELRDEVAGDA